MVKGVAQRLIAGVTTGALPSGQGVREFLAQDYMRVRCANIALFDTVCF